MKKIIKSQLSFDFVDQTTLNPVPPVGKYNWKQIVNSAGKTAVLVNTSISSELPYTQRNVTVTFGSQNQSYALNSSTEIAVFQFNQIDSQPRDYLLRVAFAVLEETGTSLFGDRITTISLSQTVRITPANGKGNQFALFHVFYLVILTMLFFM